MTEQKAGPVGFRTAQAAVAEMLRSEILAGRIAPETRLLQSEVAERFKTSTTPVREALRQLVAEGLLDGDPHRGVTVHEISLDELKEIYEIRLHLEPLAIAATVTNITDEQVDEAVGLLNQMEAEEDRTAWTGLNAEFHALLAEASGKPRLTAMLTNLRNLSALYIARSLVVMPERVAAGNAEHRQLLTAIQDEDVEAAQAVELAHLQHTLEIGELQLQVGP
ncbi:MAG: GntR family transcriptional regulator [Acidimicrobiia bacterium]